MSKPWFFIKYKGSLLEIEVQSRFSKKRGEKDRTNFIMISHFASCSQNMAAVIN